MLFKRLLLLSAGVLLLGCHKEIPKNVSIIDFDSLQGEYGNCPVEKLNGNVKDVYTGDSLFKNEYIKINFDENGRMKNCDKRAWEVVEFNNHVDSTVEERRINYEYKKDGLLITARYADGQQVMADLDILGRIVNRNYRYDKSGNLVRLKHDFHKAVEPDIIYYKYDNQDRIVELKLTEGVLLLKITYNYVEFDSHNNWIKKIVKKERYIPSAERPATDTVVRKITYY